jgi:hypothetical protein
MDTEEFVLSALKDDSMIWGEKTLRQVAFALIDTPNPDKLIEKIATRGAYDCIKLYAIFNFLVIDSMERETGESISKIKYCAQKLKQSDRIVDSLVNLKMEEIERRIQRILQISRSQADAQNAQDMIRAINRIKKHEPDIYTFQTYYSVYVLFLIETTEKNPSKNKTESLAHILNYLFLGMIKMSNTNE